MRIYHPDSVESRKREPDPAKRHAQFRAITTAYDKLQRMSGTITSNQELLEAEQEALRRARLQRNRHMREPIFIDERWKDRLIVASAVLVSNSRLA